MMPPLHTFSWMQRFSRIPLKFKLLATALLLLMAAAIWCAGLFSLYHQKRTDLHMSLRGLQRERALHALFINLLVEPLNKKPSHNQNAPFVQTAADLSLLIQNQINTFYADLAKETHSQNSLKLPEHLETDQASRESTSSLWREIQLLRKEANSSQENEKRSKLAAALQQLMVSLAADHAMLNLEDRQLSSLVHLLIFSLPSMEAPLAELALLHNPTEDVSTLKPILEKYMFLTRKLLLFFQTTTSQLYANQNRHLQEDSPLLELLTQLQIRATGFLARLEKFIATAPAKEGYEGSFEAVHTAKNIDDEAISLLQFASKVWNATAAASEHLLLSQLNALKIRERFFLFLPLALFLTALGLTFLSTLQILPPLQELLQSIERFRSGELQSRSEIRYQDEVGSVAIQLNELGDTYQSLFEQLMEKSKLLASSISQFEELYKQQEASSIQQNSTAATLFHTIEMIKQESDSISSSLGEMHEQQQSTSQLAKQGREGISALEEIMQGMIEGASSTLEILQMLQQKTIEMNLLREAIAKIAKATQMLSFNAAIEAARTPQQGSGLFIFSREVRSLADMAHDASMRLEQAAQAMHQAVRVTVLHVGHFAEQIRRNTNYMQALHKELGIIMQHMEEQSEALSHIFSSIQTQLSSTEKMHKVITNWNTLTHSTMHSMQDWSKTIHTVSNLAQEMHQSVKANPLLAGAYKKKRQITVAKKVN